MTHTTKEIFERYQVRKSKKQKTAFIDWLTPIATGHGYEVNVEKGTFGARNIVIGNPDTAKVVFSAHYDTCSTLPIPNICTPLNIPIYILYNLFLSLVLLFIPFAGLFIYFLFPGMITAGLAEFLFIFGFIYLYGGSANKHTANDNTSGVTAVIDLMLDMPNELRDKVAFVLFDMEEYGLIGSDAFARKHKATMKEKLLVNLDCVSDGETMLFCFRKKAKEMVCLFQNAFPSDERVESKFATKGFVYPSDQVNFKCGVGIVALNKTQKGLLYLDKVHTKKDTVYREENIAYLVEGCIRLTSQM